MYFLNGILNLLSFAALSVSTKDEKAFLATLFLFAFSVALEGFSVRNDTNVDHMYQHSAIILWCMRALFFISFIFIVFLSLCLVEFTHCTFEGTSIVKMFIYGTGLMGFDKFNATIFFDIIGLASIPVQWILGARMHVLKFVREKHCGLVQDGLWEAK